MTEKRALITEVTGQGSSYLSKYFWRMGTKFTVLSDAPLP